MEFTNRTEIIAALQTEFNENPKGFNNSTTNKSVEKFWTFNRLLHYYWDIKYGRKKTYMTKKNQSTGYYELKK
jgi:hypothetical protein